MKVEPNKLVLAGIAVGENKTIDPRYHFGWFTGLDELPLHASPFAAIGLLEVHLDQNSNHPFISFEESLTSISIIKAQYLSGKFAALSLKRL